jgi:hypothetical protein
VIGPGGVLYGTSAYGGLSNGTVFSLTPPATPGGSWTQTVLYSFRSNGIGCCSYPSSLLLAPRTGVLYGTTSYGVLSGVHGAAYALKPPATPGGVWTYVRLYSFPGGIAGANPQGGLVFGPGQVLYGTTPGHDSGFGTVFSLKP